MFELDLSRCSFAEEDCEGSCGSASSSSGCLSRCTEILGNCSASAEKVRDTCISTAQTVWKEKCRDACDADYVSCLDDSQDVYMKCITAECSSSLSASCQRQCRTAQRTNESACMKILDKCMTDCPEA